MNTSKIDWLKDAQNFGNALNEAGWTFLENCPEKSSLLFNTVKPALRAAIIKYGERVEFTHQSSLGAVVREYIAARDAYEAATSPPNSHAMPRQLKHGDPIALRYRNAREALNDLLQVNS